MGKKSVSWLDPSVPLDAPAGGCGPGASCIPGPHSAHDHDSPHHLAPATRHSDRQTFGRSPKHARPRVIPVARAIEEDLRDWAKALQGGVCRHPLKADDWKFDETYWRPIKWGIKGDSEDASLVDYVLELKRGPHPSEAYTQMFEQRQKWHFDCSTFVQAVYLRTMLQRLGSEAFDNRLKADSAKTQDLVLFRSHLSTGLRINGKHLTEFRAVARGTESPKKTYDDTSARIQRAPIGSEVVFTNLDTPEKTGFLHENTIKLEADIFIAHGINDGSAFAMRSDIERMMAYWAMRMNPRLRWVKQVTCITWVAQYSLD